MNLKTTLLLVLAFTADALVARVLPHITKSDNATQPERKLLSFSSTAVKQAAYEKLMCEVISPEEAQ